MKGIYITIELDPFLQDYLRGKYECFEIVFRFPKAGPKNHLPYAIETALWYPPKDYKPANFGNKSFKIELPEMSVKDPCSMNYISQNAMDELQKIFSKFYYRDWYQHVDKMLASHFGKTAIINEFMIRYHIPEKYRDRLERDYTRYKNFHYVQTYRNKQKNDEKNTDFTGSKLRSVQNCNI